MAADFDLPGETNDALPLSWPEVDCVVRLTALGRISMTGLLTLGALGASLSVDAFAAAVGKGATNQRNRWRDALRVGAVFGFFEAITPAIGWAIGLALSTWIAAVDHWIAFFLLFGVGGHMIHAATKSDVDAGQRAQTGVWRLVRFILVWAWRLPVVSVPAISLGVLNWLTGLFWTIFGAVEQAASSMPMSSRITRRSRCCHPLRC